MPIPSPADFRNKTKKHSEVREMLAQMANSAADKNSPFSTKNGVFLVKPYYEFDRKTNKLYLKLGNTAGTTDTFFIRDSRYTPVIKTKEQFISGITSNNHPKISIGITSPLGVTDCICLDYKVAVYYDILNGSFFAADRPTNGSTYPDAIKLIEVDEGEFTSCSEKEVILTQIAIQDDILAAGKNLLTNCYSDTAFIKNSISNTNRGININTETGMIEVPKDFSVMYSNPTGNRTYTTTSFYQTDHAEFSLSSELATWLILDLKTKTLVSVARSAIASYANPYITVMIVRHSTTKTSVYQVNFNGTYSINDSLFGAETFTNKVKIMLPGNPSTNSYLQSAFYPDISYDNQTLTFHIDTILRCGNRIKVLSETTIVNLAAIVSTAKDVYYDPKKDTFHVVAYNTQLTQYQRTSWFYMGFVRVSPNFRNVSFDNGIPYTVDGLLYGMPKAVTLSRNVITGLHGVAHRGVNTIAPENTASAYKLAKQYGFRAVETDIQKTKDGVWVCHHDSTLTKVTSGLLNDKVSDHNWSELKDLDVGSWKSVDYVNERLLTLQEFCELCYRLNLYAVIELTPTRTFSNAELIEITKIVSNSGVSHVYISFTYQTLLNLVAVDKAANIQYVSETIDATAVQRVKNLRTAFNDPQLSVNHTSITSKAIVDDLKNTHNIRLNCWTVNSEARVQELASCGLMSISSDFINVESLME